MSNEITVATKVDVSNLGVKGKHDETFRATQTTAGVLCTDQTIPTSDTVIAFTGVANVGWVGIKNKDATNYIDIGPTNTGAIEPLIRLFPGESCAFRLKPGVVLRGLAHTGSVKIGKTLAEI